MIHLSLCIKIIIMKTLNENIIEEDNLKIEFFGWTNSSNESYREIWEEISENQYEDNSEKTWIDSLSIQYKPKPGKEEYVEKLKRANLLTEILLTQKLFLKGIKFDGNYHQEGKYGCPLFKINDYGIFKRTFSFRHWGEIMERAGYGLTYCDWAWENPESPVTPDMVEDEKPLI